MNTILPPSFLQKSPKTIVKVDSIQVSVCDTGDIPDKETKTQVTTCPQSSSSSRSDQESGELGGRTSCADDNLLQNSLQTNNLQMRNFTSENLLHPRDAKNVAALNTALNLPELIGRKEKLV